MKKNLKKNITKYISVGLLFLVPAISLAAPLDGIATFLCSIIGILDIVMELVVALAIIYFFWGLIKFIQAAGDAKLRAEGQARMLWGIVALFVMFSIYGILTWIGNTVAISPDPNAATAACSAVGDSTPASSAPQLQLI